MPCTCISDGANRTAAAARVDLCALMATTLRALASERAACTRPKGCVGGTESAGALLRAVTHQRTANRCGATPRPHALATPPSHAPCHHHHMLLGVREPVRGACVCVCAMRDTAHANCMLLAVLPCLVRPHRVAAVAAATAARGAHLLMHWTGWLWLPS